MSILEDTNGYKYHPELWKPQLFAFICSTLNMNFVNPNLNSDSSKEKSFTYFTLDGKEFTNLNLACSHQLDLLLKDSDWDVDK